MQEPNVVTLVEFGSKPARIVEMKMSCGVLEYLSILTDVLIGVVLVPKLKNTMCRLHTPKFLREQEGTEVTAHTKTISTEILN